MELEIPEVYIINPKAIKKEGLIGKYEKSTGKFIDGILTKLSRKVIKE